MFELTEDPIAVTDLNHEQAGGFVRFDGKVRNFAGGREVLRLEYEAYPELALSEGARLVDEAMERFGLSAAHVIHRTGVLDIGETAVCVQVSAPHRREAFAGCEWIIDQLKVRVPIWKRESYVSGDSGWIGAEAAPANPQSDQLYVRQMSMPEIGIEGQARLGNARVLMVGLGGLASGSLPILAGAGVGSLGLLDADTVEMSNLHRQHLYGFDDQGRSKADRAAAFVRRLRPQVNLDVFPHMLDERNVDDYVRAYDWIIDGTDSLEVKFLLNAAVKRHARRLVTASIHRFEGHLMTISPTGPCLQCLFPEPPPSGCVDTCADSGVMPGLPTVFGALQANAVLRGILGLDLGDDDHMWLFDLRTLEATTLARSSRQGCCGCAGQTSARMVEVHTLDEVRARWEAIRIIDLRELNGDPLPVDAERINAESLLASPPAEPLVLICHRGITSLSVAHELRRLGNPQAFSLRGGAERLRSGAMSGPD